MPKIKAKCPGCECDHTVPKTYLWVGKLPAPIFCSECDKQRGRGTLSGFRRGRSFSTKVPPNHRGVILLASTVNLPNQEVTIGDETHLVREWARIKDINTETIRQRIQKGLSMAEAITNPKKAEVAKSEEHKRKFYQSTSGGYSDSCPEDGIVG